MHFTARQGSYNVHTIFSFTLHHDMIAHGYLLNI